MLNAAERIWNDIVDRKIYITGAVGALPVGISKRGFKVWEAFGREYQLPHRTAYNETCANITWGMFCRSMFMATGEPKYADEMERIIYNAGISGMSIAGDASTTQIHFDGTRIGTHTVNRLVLCVTFLTKDGKSILATVARRKYSV